MVLAQPKSRRNICRETQMPSENEECGAFFVYKTRGVKVVNPYQLGARIRVQGIIPCRELRCRESLPIKKGKNEHLERLPQKSGNAAAYLPRVTR